MRSVPCGGITWGEVSRGPACLRRRFGEEAWPETSALFFTGLPPGSDDPSERLPMIEGMVAPANRMPRFPQPQRPCEGKYDRDARETDEIGRAHV